MGGSHYVEALRADPELLEALLEREEAEDEDEDRKKSWSPPPTEWRQETELLTTISDQLAALLSVTSATSTIPPGGKQPGKVAPYPRPRRLIDKYRMDRADRRRGELDNEVEQAKQRWREARDRGELPDDN